MRNKILADREKRLLNVKAFFNLYPEDSLVMIKANIPGANKNYPISSYLIKFFLNIIKGTYSPFYLEFYESYDGPYYLCGIKGKNEKIKKSLINIEDNHELGRFVDLDFFIDGEKSLSRQDFNLPLRKCILCNNDALYCIRTEAHEVNDILLHIEKTTVFFFADLIVDLVDYAILRELKIDQKFGLVSLTSSGSHPDMNYQTMLKAKNSILYYFKKMVILGYQAEDLTTLLSSVRVDGLEAEKKMFEATNGINCYKGIIFLLGLSALSFGYTIKTSTCFNDVFKNIKIISEDIYEDFYLNYDTIGVKLFHEYGITGVRGVAKNGFEVIKKNLDKLTISSTDQELRALLYHFIITSEDTVFIKRSKSYQRYLRFKDVIKQYDPNDLEDLSSLNKFAEKFNLSFGGSADLLIVAIFFINLKELFIT